ncbi:MAG TPA: pectinesterase family protein [Flavisolibacter sp.]|nr:pectinesterase family protein [Flavisolibacter sp.]
MKTIINILVAVYIIIASGCAVVQSSSVSRTIIVAQDGSGDYKSIQDAINSLPDTSVATRIIRIKRGTYKEKIFLTKHNVVLEGEDRETTILTQDIARDEWRCDHANDWGVATFNIAANDVTLKNLTIANDYGFNFKEPRVVPCAADTVTGKKTITKDGHQMAFRTRDNTTTRFKAINCRFRAWAGDTVSPWNLQDGMFYFKDCLMEGGVDFYCPRGFAYAENCTFYANTGPAAIWHDGSTNPDYKTVLKNCTFDGYKGFKLGRYHREAQFFLINSKFSQNMADADIYFVPGNQLQWGRRVYYYNNHRDGGNFAWHANNLHTAPGAPDVNDITAEWVFNGKWNPENDVTATAHVRLRKRSNDGSYGEILHKEVMPVHHPANDFTKQAIPYYQTEGPAWENDKVGFRIYLDVRNAKDIFGKTTSVMVMDTVGTFGDKYYHNFDPRWGMDILKVGTSLGAGGLAIQLKSPTGTDTLIRLGGTAVQQTSYEVLKDGPDEAVFRLHYKNWKVFDRTYNLTEEISIKPGDYFYESRVTMNGLQGDEKLVTGIVNLKTSRVYNLEQGNASVIYTHDVQSENNDVLGMAVMVDKKFNPVFGEQPREGSGITNTYTAAMKIRNNQPVVFRFYAGWEQTNKSFRDKEYFKNFLVKEANKPASASNQ